MPINNYIENIQSKVLNLQLLIFIKPKITDVEFDYKVSHNSIDSHHEKVKLEVLSHLLLLLELQGLFG